MTTPTEAVSLLSRLLSKAEDILMKPIFKPTRDEELEALVEGVRLVAHSPVESAELRFVDDVSHLLAQSLARVEYSRMICDDRRVVAWSQIAGVLVPVVRADLGRAIEARRTVRPTP